MPVKKNQKIEKKDDSAGIFIPAGLFIGMGIGLLTDNFIAWLFIGLGAGFITMAIAKAAKKK